MTTSTKGPTLGTCLPLALAALLLAGCNGGADEAAAQDAQTATPPEPGTSQQARPTDAPPFTVESVAEFDEPWALRFLPDGRLLVTEKRGALRLFDPASGRSGEVGGVPEVDYGGQGGFGDIALHPDFERNGTVYLSYAEAGEGDTRGAAVARATLALDEDGGGQLSDLQVIWRQHPKVTGRGHYAHRLLFGPDGHLWISSGDRQKFDPAQDMQSNMGKILRLKPDGSVPEDNPFVDQGGVAAQVWSLGHRNPLGIAFDAEGRLWVNEMGPRDGDELNLVHRGANYGYPVVSNGDHYDGRTIPDHGSEADRGFEAPKITWTPVISPSSLMFYSGAQFPDWQGDALIGGLSSRSLVRVEIDGEGAREAARYPMDNRIRGVAQGPDGALWLIEDEREGRGGALLRLTPAG